MKASAVSEVLTALNPVMFQVTDTSLSFGRAGLHSQPVLYMSPPFQTWHWVPSAPYSLKPVYHLHGQVPLSEYIK